MSVARDDNRPVMLSVDHVSKSFKLPTEQASGLKQAVINWTRGIKGYRIQEVLKDISFEVNQGDFFGIVGRNGSGKSTLLKLISQIYQPESGTIQVNGTLVPFIELGVGFNPELTGRENIYLNGALLGFSRKQIDAMYDDIVAFAELEEFMDQKLKNYSSGMQVRLAFSVAIKAQGDILVLDEVLAVGDEAFQRKCDNFFREVREDPSKTVILVTHDMGAVKRYCNKAIFIREGEIAVSGDKEAVAEAYSLENLYQSKAERETASEYPLGLNATIPSLKVIARQDTQVRGEGTFAFDVEYECTQDIPHFMSVSLLDAGRGGIILDTGERGFANEGAGVFRHELELPLSAFNSSALKLYATVRTVNDDGEGTHMIAFTNDENTCDLELEGAHEESYALLAPEAVAITPRASSRSNM